MFDRCERFLPPHSEIPSQSTGKGYILKGELIETPFSVHTRNFITLNALHQCILGLCLGAETEQVPQFDLSESKRTFFIEQFSKLPRNSSEYQMHRRRFRTIT